MKFMDNEFHQNWKPRVSISINGKRFMLVSFLDFEENISSMLWVYVLKCSESKIIDAVVHGSSFDRLRRATDLRQKEVLDKIINAINEDSEKFFKRVKKTFDALSLSAIASRVPYMIASGNHERNWPGLGSFYGNMDSGGECGVLAEKIFYIPAENRAELWYSTDYGMFRFCIADTEHDWREGTEQYKFIEHCLASVNRQKQPWLIFIAHRVLGYSSATCYAEEGSFAEPMGREIFQKLGQKYKVDIDIYGHAHNYERTCTVYQNICTNNEKRFYKGTLNGTINMVTGGGGAGLAEFTMLQTKMEYIQGS